MVNACIGMVHCSATGALVVHEQHDAVPNEFFRCCYGCVRMYGYVRG